MVPQQNPRKARYGGSCLFFQLLGRQRLGRFQFKTSPGKKLARILLNQHAYNPSYVESLGSRIAVQG
jgi:hypothetical protein